MSGYLIITGCFFGFILLPPFGLSIRTINNITDPYKAHFLPLQACYPFDYGRSPIFELVYLTQVVAGVFAGVSYSVPDNLFGALVFHACARCEILVMNTRALLQSEDVAELNYGHFKTKLGEIVESHVRLVR